MIAVDETTIDYLRGRPFAPTRREWDARRRATGARCAPTPARSFDRVVELDAATVAPQVTWGTSPEMVVVDRATACPIPTRERDAGRRDGDGARAAATWALEPNTPIDRHPHRQGVHRLVHQLAHRGPARGGGGRARSARRVAGNVKLALVVPGLGPGEGAGRARRARPRLHATPASNGASRAARCAWR